MAKRYTAKEREDAALLCAVVASTPGHSYPDAAKALGIHAYGHASALASAAWESCQWNFCGSGDYESDAEAEALIRTGWSPR